MGQQLIIIEGAGTFDLERIKKLVAAANEGGMEIHHASVRYQGTTHFTHGTGADLARTMADLGHIVEVQQGSTPGKPAWEGAVETVTLGTVNDNVLEVLKILKRHEPKAEKAPKPPKEEKKKGPPEDKPQEQPSSPPTGDDPNTDLQPPTGAPGDAPTDAQAENTESQPEA